MKNKERKLAAEFELPYTEVVIKKLESNHNNVPRICQGQLYYPTIKVGESFHVAGDMGITTTPVTEIELLEDGGVQFKTRNSTYVIYNRADFKEKITFSDMMG